MSGIGRAAALVALLTSVVGCAGVTAVDAVLRHPAEVPVRAFPRVLILPDDAPQTQELADALALHLLSSGLEDARVVDWDWSSSLPPQAPGTAVVRLALSMASSGRTRWITRPQTVCTAFGCYTDSRAYPVYTPITEGRLTVTVVDGSTRERLQRVTLRTQATGSTQVSVERTVVAELADQIRSSVDQRLERVRIELYEVDREEVERAVALMREARWHEAREILERFRERGELASLGDEARARALYDLSMARRFDPTTMDDPDRHFAAARAALEQAMELESDPRFTEALARLTAHHRQMRILVEQERAAEHNQRVAAGQAPPPSTSTGEGSIPIPDSYGP